jgi:hypothetical protein
MRRPGDDTVSHVVFRGVRARVLGDEVDERKPRPWRARDDDSTHVASAWQGVFLYAARLGAGAGIG